MKKVIYTLILCQSMNIALGQTYVDSLDNQLASIYQTSGLPGFSVSIINPDGVLFSKGYGFANKEQLIPYTEKTTQPIASISKTFIAIAVMKSIEEGHFNLNTPINDLLPFKVLNPHLPNDTIRIKHLVNHTSGIIDSDNYWRNVYYLIDPPEFEKKSYTDEEKYFFNAISENQRVEESVFLKNYLFQGEKWYSESNFSSSAAGTRFDYCNVGASLMAYIVEIVQAMPYSKYVQKFIFNPLNMHSSNWDFERPIEPSAEAILYLNNGDPCPKLSFSTYSDGAIRSSNVDMQKYLMEMIKGASGRGTLLEDDSYSTMFKPTVDADETDSVGVFWFTQKFLGDRMHQGSGAGIATVINFDPTKNIGCVLMSNHEAENEQQSAGFIAIWKTLIKYRELLTAAKK